jgi:hypothetical protein
MPARRREKESLCVSLTSWQLIKYSLCFYIERDKLTAAIEALQGSTTTEKTHPPESVGPTAPVKRKMSAAGRRAIIAGAKKRSAAIKAATATAAAAASAPVAATPKATPAKAPAPVKKGGLTEAGRKALSIAMKKRWAAKKKASAGMAKANA